MTRRWKWFLGFASLALILDQATKIWARNSLPVGPNGYGIRVPVIENFFDWAISQNAGSAFGLFSGWQWPLTIVGFLALGLIYWMFTKTKDDQIRLIVALGLVAGGAVGNLIDRVAFGTVTDFIVWRYYETAWPTFNIADVALVIGVGLLFLDSKKLEENTAKPAKGAEQQGKKKSKKPKKKVICLQVHREEVQESLSCPEKTAA